METICICGKPGRHRKAHKFSWLILDFITSILNKCMITFLGLISASKLVIWNKMFYGRTYLLLKEKNWSWKWCNPVFTPKMNIENLLLSLLFHHYCSLSVYLWYMRGNVVNLFHIRSRTQFIYFSIVCQIFTQNMFGKCL
jgi:hypothetical protein